MKRQRLPHTRILIALFAIVIAIAGVVWLSRVSRNEREVLTSSEAHPSPSEHTGPPSQTPPKTNSDSVVHATTPPPAIPVPGATPASLIVPVAGVRPDQLQDTFSDARAEGRAHDAIDIPAPRGTPVLAAADGTILRLFQSERGGTTIYQLSTDSRYVYYYAHLERYADGLAVGHLARQGETLAYVGDTGNAVPGNYHLHFSISLISNPKRYWEGMNINPYPLLRK